MSNTIKYTVIRLYPIRSKLVNKSFGNTAHIIIKKDIKNHKGIIESPEYLVTELRPEDSIGPRKLRFIATVKDGKLSYELVPLKIKPN